MDEQPQSTGYASLDMLDGVPPPAPQKQPLPPELAPAEGPFARTLNSIPNPLWHDPSIDPQTKLDSILKTKAATQDMWENVKPILERTLPGVDATKMEQHYHLEAARQNAAKTITPDSESTLDYVKAHMLADLGIQKTYDTVQYAKSLQRFNDGKASQKDAGIIATYERHQEIERAKGAGEGALDMVAGAPALAAEVLSGGRALRAVGLGAETVAKTVPTLVGRTAAQTALQTAATPRFYAPGAAENLAEKATQGAKEGEVTDLKNLAPAAAMGFLQTAVLGQVQSQAAGIKGFIPRLAAKTGIGLGEQQVVDAIGGVSGLQTDYGAGADFLNGRSGEGWKKVAGQAAVFGLFAVAHNSPQKAKALNDAFESTVNDLKKQGFSSSKVADELGKINDAIEAGQKPDTAGMSKPLLKYADAAVEAMKPPEKPTPTEVPPARETPPATTPEAAKAILEEARQAGIVAPHDPESVQKHADEFAQSGKVPQEVHDAADQAIRAAGYEPASLRSSRERGIQRGAQVWRDAAEAEEAARPAEVGGEGKPAAAEGGAVEPGHELDFNHPDTKQEHADETAILRKQGLSESAAAEQARANLQQDFQAGIREGIRARARWEEAQASRRAAAGPAEHGPVAGPDAVGAAGPAADAGGAGRGAEQPGPGAGTDLFGRALPRQFRSRGGQQLSLEESHREILMQKADEWAAEHGEKIIRREAPNRFWTEKGAYEVGREDAGYPIHKAGEPEPGRGTILSFADRLEAEATAALKQKLGGKLFSGIDPTILPDVAKLVAAKIIKGGYTLAQWAKDAVERFGDGIKPHIQAIWDMAQKHVATGKGANVTGIKNEVTDGEREARGLPPILSQARKADPKTWDEAMARVAAEPDVAKNLVTELAKKNRPTSREENALLLYRKVELNNERSKAIEQVLEASQKGTPAQIAEAAAKEKEAGDKVDEIDRVAKATGYEWGAAGRFRQLLAKEDFSLVSMVKQLEVAKGDKLTPEELEKVADLQKQVEDLQTKRSTAEDTMTTALGKPGLKQRGIDVFNSPEYKAMDAAQVASARAEESFRRMVEDARTSAQPIAQRLEDLLVRIRREFLISSPVTLLKVATASAVRSGITPIEQLTGAVWRQVPGLTKIAAIAPREGRGISLVNELKSKEQAATQGFKDAMNRLKTGQSDADVMFGKRLDEFGKSWWEFSGTSHGMTKDFATADEYTRSILTRLDDALAKGKDLSVAELMQIRLEAYKDSQAAKFQQDNLIVRKYQDLVRGLEKSDSWLGRRAATGAKLALPIVRVPTNLVAEMMKYAFGLPGGTVHAIQANIRGLDKLKPAEADLIMQQFKKGSLGAAALMTGYLLPAAFGGFYQKDEKRKADDVKFGGARVGGIDIPTWALHNPLLEVFQLGATVRRVSDTIKKGQEKGIGQGIIEGLAGAAEEVPFVRQPVEYAKLLNPQERGWAFGALARDMVVPKLVQWLAGQRDRDARTAPAGASPLVKQFQSEPTKRKPATTLQHVKMGVPGLRETVPIK